MNVPSTKMNLPKGCVLLGFIFLGGWKGIEDFQLPWLVLCFSFDIRDKHGGFSPILAKDKSSQ